jgi:O-antigen/teichoic acid export membrane protein
MGYTREAIKGVSWIGGIRVVIRTLSFAKTLVIARILSPAQFGIFGISTLVLSFVEILTETGINVFLVQQKDKVDSYISTAWIVSIIRGLVISLSIVFSAKYISSFFATPDAYPLLLLIAIVPFVRGFINPSVIKLQKDLLFKKEFLYRSSLFLIESLVSIILVILTRNIASLVIALIISACCEVFLSFVIVSPKPSLVFVKEKLWEILRFGKWITTAGIFNYLYQHGDDIVIARILGAPALGLYDMAYKISLSPLSDIGDVVTKVTYPVYVKISEDRERLKSAFIKTVIIVIVFTFPIGILLFFYPIQVISLLLGEQWLASAPALQILGIFGVVRALSVFGSTLFLSVEKKQLFTYITFIGSLGLGITIIPFVMLWGIVGAAFSALVGTILTIPFIFYHIFRIFYEKD